MTHPIIMGRMYMVGLVIMPSSVCSAYWPRVWSSGGMALVRVSQNLQLEGNSGEEQTGSCTRACYTAWKSGKGERVSRRWARAAKEIATVRKGKDTTNRVCLSAHPAFCVYRIATPLAGRTCHHDHCRTQLRPRVEAFCVREGVVVPFDWFSDWEMMIDGLGMFLSSLLYRTRHWGQQRWLCSRRDDGTWLSFCSGS